MGGNQNKFKALVHFILYECRGKVASLGAIRLNKALWYSDVMAYKMREGKSITESEYVKRNKGPVPRYILRTLEELSEENTITIEEPQFPYDTRKFICRKAPEDELLSDEEKKIALLALDIVFDRTANEISEETHTIIWNAAKQGETIPLYATLAESPGEVTPEIVGQIERAWQHR